MLREHVLEKGNQRPDDRQAPGVERVGNIYWTPKVQTLILPGRGREIEKLVSSGTETARLSPTEERKKKTTSQALTLA